MNAFREAMELVGLAVDAAGVFVIVGGALYATARVCFGPPRGEGGAEPSRYRSYRQDLGRSILLGLEFLVAADIIRTVVVDPTLDNVIVLGVIVLVRTFLSLALQVELEGRWPWHRHAESRGELIPKAPASGQPPEPFS